MTVAISGMGTISGAGVGHAPPLSGWHHQSAPNRVTIAQKQPPFNRPTEAVSARDFDAGQLLGKKGLQFLTRSTQLLLGAAHLAIAQAGFALDRERDNLGLVIGTNLSNLATMATYDWIAVSEGPSFVSPMDAPNTLANAAASQLAIRLGANNVNTTISTGRCASLDAIGYAAHFLEEGRASAILAGGTEEVNPYVLWQLESQAHQFDHAIAGEAAAVMLLRREQDAGSERALAHVAAWANALAPHAPPEQLVQEVCAEALDLARLKPDQICLLGLDVSQRSDWPLAEGVAKAIDPAIRSDFRPVPAFSLKGMVGETLGAAGVLHAVAAVTAIRSHTVPPTPGLLSESWPKELAFEAQPREFDPGPALIAAWDPSGFASAVVLSPAYCDGR